MADEINTAYNQPVPYYSLRETPPAEQQPTTQQARNAAIIMDKQRAEIERARDAARKKEAEMLEQRAQALAKADADYANQAEASFYSAELGKHLQVGGTRASFEKEWPGIWRKELQQRRENFSTLQRQALARHVNVDYEL